LSCCFFFVVIIHLNKMVYDYSGKTIGAIHGLASSAQIRIGYD
jgi:hypothetical protein